MGPNFMLPPRVLKSERLFEGRGAEPKESNHFIVAVAGHEDQSLVLMTKPPQDSEHNAKAGNDFPISPVPCFSLFA